MNSETISKERMSNDVLVDDIFLQLRLAFDQLSHKGLFFWHSLLIPQEIPYEDFVKKTFADLLKKTPDEKKELLEFYQKIAQNLIYMRNQVMVNPEVRAEVEKIRDAILEKLAHETIMDQIRKDLVGLTISKE